MKASELMIGDWVVGNTNEPFQIQEILPDFPYWDEIKPIPLTPEILEKNGFESRRDAGYIDDDYNGTQIIYDSWNHQLRILIRYKVALDIEAFGDMYVHQLQHALRLCGIDKEIKL